MQNTNIKYYPKISVSTIALAVAVATVAIASRTIGNCYVHVSTLKSNKFCPIDKTAE